MKKFFFHLIFLNCLFLFFIFLLPQKNTVFAGGTFDCHWVAGGGIPPHCTANNVNCTDSDEADYVHCAAYTPTGDQAGCNADVGIACVGEGEGTIDPVPDSLPDIFCVGGDPDTRTNDPSSGEIATAIGCIPFGNTQDLATFFLVWGLGVGGGIALILIVVAGYMVTTSSGNPQRLQAGKELLTAAITGLVMLLFAVYILRVVGVQILRIPGF